jgi:CheY-like chemotaxis protein
MYDVILMDIHMPEMDGYEASRRIRIMSDPTKANIPIIALTASVSHDLSKKITQRGINDYLRKPFNAKELYAKLKHIAASQEK